MLFSSSTGRVLLFSWLLLPSLVSTLPLHVVPSKVSIEALAVRHSSELNGGKVKFQDVNLIQLTDVHSWLSGHMHEEGNEATYADVLAFVEHLQEMAWKDGKDIFLFNTGDIVEGTGLSDATSVHGSLITPIIEQMPFAALTCGNHELYHNSTITNLVSSGFVSHWGGKYLTANIHNASTDELIGSPYTVVSGRHGQELVVMGFLYDMENACGAVRVSRVEEALQQAWFKEAMAKAASADAIVVLVHMGARDPLAQTIRASIRELRPDAPVIFLAGHTHVRDFQIFDERCVALESGKFLDTVGLLSCQLPDKPDAALDCDRTYVTPHVPTFMELTGTDAASFETEGSAAMRQDLLELRKKLHLDDIVGCSPSSFDPHASLDDKHSMWELYLQRVLPDTLFPDHSLAVVVASTGALRYKLFQGQVELDETYTVSPFKDVFLIAHMSGLVMGDLIKHILKQTLNMGTERSSDVARFESLPLWVSSKDPKELHNDVVYDLIFAQFDEPALSAAYKSLTGWELESSPFREGEVDSCSVWETYIREHWPCMDSRQTV